MLQPLRLVQALSVLIVVANGSVALAQEPASADPRANVNALYANLPLQFEANQGQTDPQVRFTSHGSGYSLFLTGQEAVLLLGKSTPADPRASGAAAFSPAPSTRPAGVLRMQLVGARADADISGAEKLPGIANYFIGNDPAKWRSGVPTYAKVRYGHIYDGIDLLYYGNQRRLEYDFVLSPGASADRIRLRFAGAQKLRIGRDGDLRITAADGTVAFHKPVIYQEANGVRQPVEGRFALLAGHTVGFALGAYDRTRPLVIDPVLEYATYLGGSTWDQAWAIAVDKQGNAIVGGGTESIDFPTTPSTFDTSKNAPVGTMTGFVSKLNSNGTGLVFSTYIGGSLATSVFAIAVAPSGNIFAAGGTAAKDFPETAWGIITFGKPGNAFVVELPPTGSQLNYSDQFGGNGGEYVAGIAVDSAENAYVTGPTSSVDFPVTQGAYQTTRLTNTADTVFVTKINPSGTAFVYSTYLGGSTDELSTSIAIDGSLNAYITGTTSSTDFPVTSEAYQKTRKSAGATGFVTKLNPAGNGLGYSTYLGGSVQDTPFDIAVNSGGQAFVTGATGSADFPVSSGALMPTKTSAGATLTAFVTRFNTAGSTLLYSTFLGGSATNTAASIAVDGSNDAFVVGRTASDDFPITPGAIQTARNGVDAFVSKLNSTGSALLYSTFLGGSQADYANAIALNGTGRAYVAGGTESTDFPTSYGAVQGTNNAADQVTAFVARLDLSSATGGPMATTTTLTATPNPAISGNTVKFIASVNPANGSVMPGGSVSFTIDGNSVGTQTLDSGGVATYSTSLLSVGTHTAKAAYAGSASFAASSSSSLTETINPPQTAAPVFSPSAGAYILPQKVTITDATPYAVIYYTKDGTTPTTSSPKYTGPITVSSPTTFKAIATANGYVQSIVSSATYTMAMPADAPAFSPAAGTYGASQLVTLSTTTPNPTFYYTTNGAAPTASSTKYTQPIAVNASQTIKAIATAPGYSASPVTSAAYTIVGSPQVLTGLATSISTSGATLNATVNSQGVTGSVWFAWGTDKTSLTSTTPKVPVSASNSFQPASAALTGLAGKTTYYFKPIISTLGGYSTGALQSFTTQ